MNWQDRLSKLLSSSFLLCLAGAIYEALNGNPALAFAAVVSYLLVDRLPQVIAVLKGLDALAEGFHLAKVDAFLDSAVAGLEKKLAGGAVTVVSSGAPSAPVIEAPLADALGKS